MYYTVCVGVELTWMEVEKQNSNRGVWVKIFMNYFSLMWKHFVRHDG